MPSHRQTQWSAVWVLTVATGLIGALKCVSQYVCGASRRERSRSLSHVSPDLGQSHPQAISNDADSKGRRGSREPRSRSRGGFNA